VITEAEYARYLRAVVEEDQGSPFGWEDGTDVSPTEVVSNDGYPLDGGSE
jgi:hypothetical protein